MPSGGHVSSPAQAATGTIGREKCRLTLGTAAASRGGASSRVVMCRPVAGHSGDPGGPGGPGHGRVPVPRHDRARDPEARVGLLALRAGQPAEGVDAPASTDRAGARVALAERGAIGMPGNAGTQLAPHDRHPQLITDHSPHSGPGGRSAPGEGFGPGAALGAGSWPGIAAGRHPAASAGLLGGAVVPQLGEPVVHLEHAGVVWPDPDLHVGPPLVPKVSVVQPRMTCSGAGACTGMTDRGRRLRVLGVPGSGAASGASTVMPGDYPSTRGTRPAVSQRLVCPGRRPPPLRLPSPFQAPGLTVFRFKHSRSRLRITAGYTSDKHLAYI